MSLRDQSNTDPHVVLDTTVDLLISEVGDGCWDWSIGTETAVYTGTSDSRAKAEANVLRLLPQIVGASA